MKLRFVIIISLFLCIFLSYSFMSTYYYKETSAQQHFKKTICISPVSSKSPSNIYGHFACLIDGHTGRILWSKNAEQKVPMASTTKILTCLLALENQKPNQIVTVSKRASSMPKVHLGMSPGQKFYLKDLLYSLMLVSHNDSAVAISEAIGGSMEQFATMMNLRAKQIGLNRSHFVTPNGLDANEHYSTARDMCLLAKEAMKNDLFTKIITTPAYSFCELTSQKKFVVSNKDAFLTMFEGANGIKTGFTSKAGYCFIGAAKRDTRKLICSTLAAGWPPNKSFKWKDSIQLMNYGFEEYQMKTLPIIDLSRLKISIENGKKSNITLLSVASPKLLLGKSDSIKIIYKIPKKMKAPIDKGEKVASIVIKINKDYSLSLPVYSKDEVAKATYIDYFLSILHRLFWIK